MLHVYRITVMAATLRCGYGSIGMASSSPGDVYFVCAEPIGLLMC